MSYVSCNNTKLNTLHSNQLRIFCTKYTESCRFNMIIKPVLSKPGKLKGCLEHSAQKSIIISLIVSYSIIGLSILISFNDRLSILKETNQVWTNQMRKGSRKRPFYSISLYGNVKHTVCPIEFVNVAFLYRHNIFIPLPQVHIALCRLHAEWSCGMVECN